MYSSLLGSEKLTSVAINMYKIDYFKLLKED